MNTYKVILKNGKEMTVTEYAINDIKNIDYVESVSPVEPHYNINTIAEIIISCSKVISKKNTIFYCKFERPCDTVFFEMYKYSNNEWGSIVKFVVDRKKCGKDMLKSVISIEKFYELFFLDIECYKQSKTRVLSTAEMNKIRKICFYNKNGIKAFFDNFGNIYYCYKATIPTKKSKEEYKTLKDNPNCIFVCYVDGLHNRYRYFENVEAAKQYMSDNHITTWSIERYGFKGGDPENKKIYQQLPYYNILKEVSLAGDYTKVAWRWSKASDINDFGTLLILVKAYLDFKRNDELARFQILSEQ